MANILTPQAVLDSLDGAYRDSVTIVDFTARCWAAKVTSKEAAALLAAHTGAKEKVFRVQEYLFTGTEYHANVVAAKSTVYNTAKEMAKCSGSLGTWAIPNSSIEEFIGVVDPLIENFDRAYQEFYDHYEEAVMTGMKGLGKLAAVADKLYVPKRDLREKFEITYDFLPLPDGNSYGNLPTVTLQRLQARLEINLRGRLLGTFEEAVVDLKTALGELRERLEEKIEVADEVITDDRRRSIVRLTSAVREKPLNQARILRRFARGEWAKRLSMVEDTLELLANNKHLAKDVDLQAKAVKMIQSIERALFGEQP